jgi:hypothetical protein
MRLFLYRKEVTSSVESVHDSYGDAEAWARWRCHRCYDEVFDVSDDSEVRISVGQPRVYGRKIPWQANVFYVTMVSDIKRGPPPYDPELPYENESDDSEGSSQYEEADDEHTLS